MDVGTSKRDPDFDLVASGDITVTFRGGRQVVEPSGQAPAEDPGLHQGTQEEDI
jgi:hypothetical protein